MDVKELQTSIEAKFEDLKKQVEEKTADKAGLEKKYNDLVTEFEDLKAKSENTEKFDALQKHLDKLDVKLQKKGGFQNTVSKKTFFGRLGETLSKGSKDLENLKNGKVNSINLSTKAEDEDLDETTHNFTDSALDFAVTDARGLRDSAFSPLWLRNFLPNGTTNGSVIQYLKEDGANGAVGVWDGTGAIDDLSNKPGVSPKFDFETDNVIWIAGITRVKREMLDDVAWLRGYLSRKLLTGKYGLYVAENTQILDVLTDPSNSTSYDGGNTNFVEAVYDAAFGQLQDNYHYPTVIFVNNRDLVNLMALNKAEGSGEYDLPPNTVAMVNNQLTIGGVPVVGTPAIDAGKFLVMDANETEFITRMNPEVRFFEQDRDNVPKNLITIRIEARILPVVYDSTAVIYGEVAEEVED